MRGLLCCVLLLSCAMVQARPNLHEAAQQGYAEAAAELLRKKKRGVHKKDKYGNTPLHYAAGYAHADIAELLLGYGADVNAVNSKFATTPLHEIARTTQRDRRRVVKTVRVLITAGADLNAVDDHGEKPLLAAARTGNAAVVRGLLDADPDAASTAELEQALVSARQHSRYEVIALLETRGAQSARGLGDSLLNASTLGDYAVAERLLDSGAQVDIVNETGETPLLLASAAGHTEFVRLLVSRGARVNKYATDGRGPLHAAAAASNFDVVAVLIDSGAKINANSKVWGTPLNSAANKEAIHVADYLLERGAEPARVVDTPERAFGSGLAFKLYADRAAGELVESDLTRYRETARNLLQTARAGLETEREAHEVLKRKEQRSDAFYDAVGTVIAGAVVGTLQYMQEQQAMAARKQTAQIAALKGATSYQDYHVRYDLYKQALVDPVTNKPFQLDFSDTTLANTVSVSGLDVIISEYDRRLALTDTLIDDLGAQ